MFEPSIGWHPIGSTYYMLEFLTFTSHVFELPIGCHPIGGTYNNCYLQHLCWICLSYQFEGGIAHTSYGLDTV
jgi:hypothetical protein